MAAVAAPQECGFIRQLLLSLGIVLENATKSYEEKTGRILLANNPMTTTGKTKHLDVKYNFIRGMVKPRSIQFLWCKTEDILADALTQFPLPTTTHQRLVSLMITRICSETTLV